MAVEWTMQNPQFLDFKKAMTSLQYNDLDSAKGLRDAYLKTRFDQYALHHDCAQGGKARMHSKTAEQAAAAPGENVRYSL